MACSRVAEEYMQCFLKGVIVCGVGCSVAYSTFVTWANCRAGAEGGWQTATLSLHCRWYAENAPVFNRSRLYCTSNNASLPFLCAAKSFIHFIIHLSFGKNVASNILEEIITTLIFMRLKVWEVM